ncbi:MAG: DUF2905 domain-containing protein [Gammaproteobacteria bacterium]|nr:DUF2905 domain-containing protein [Gammaproteobacteria bacterium]MDH5594328.1 DUF2905 domain-containing protein [Gammaproteobacteria bacterium]MDH5613416.1 DUF2905 domain-containing protein [Gammaproteobacteria bacterium]
MSRLFITLGIVLVILGLLWPWLQKSGLGRLPGDIIFERGNLKFYFPLMTSIIISLVLTLLFWLFKK